MLLQEIQKITLTQITYDGQTNIKRKEEIGFMDLVCDLRKGKQYILAKFPKPVKLAVDFQSVTIKGKNQLLVLMSDNSTIRQREKAQIQSEMQTLFFASVAHDLRTPLNSLLASNNSLLFQAKGSGEVAS